VLLFIVNYCVLLGVSSLSRYVLKFNAEVPEVHQAYEELAQIVFPQQGTDDRGSFADKFRQLSIELEVPQRLRDLNINEADIEMLAREAMLQERLLPNNPREVTYDDALRLYQEAW